jgi:dihydroorotate dehydrogenase electron transfer subunit
MIVAVRTNRPLSPDCWQMEIEWPSPLPDPVPGQFVMVKTRESTDPLWRRPFGVHDFQRRRAGSTARLLYQVVGPTTKDLAARKPGEALDLVGPLGSGFELEAREHWLVAGGRGMAPLYFLARRLRRRGSVQRVFVGGRSADHVLMTRELKRLGISCEVATEDGSLGRRGLVTDLVERSLKRLSPRRREGIVISACGPEGMLRRIGEGADTWGARAQVSLDTLMACGQGYCQGCTVTTRDGYRLCCREGPVFDARELVW